MAQADWYRAAVTGWLSAILTLLACVASPAQRAASADENWPTSPFRAIIDGMTGKPIPSICSYRGRNYTLGDRVCMQTPIGIVTTRCDLVLNNTSWMPTTEPCTIEPEAGPRQPPK